MACFDKKFYYPTRKRYADPRDYGLEYELVRIKTSDGVSLSGWWFPGREPRGTVVHCHGNAGNITGHFTHVAWLPAAGYNLFCFDYRGYGESEGQITRSGSIIDAHSAVDYVRSLSAVEPGTVLLFGQSMGASVAIVVAAERKDLCGVVSDGAFSDYQEEARWVLKQSCLTRRLAGLIARWGIARGYDPIDHVERIAPTPLFLIHGKEDRICPWEMSQDLYDRAREPKGLWLVPGADHYDALGNPDGDGRTKLIEFLDACVTSTALENPHTPSFDA